MLILHIFINHKLNLRIAVFFRQKSIKRDRM